jgi:hypothetical protein
VSREDAGEWAKSRGMLFMEASAKTKEGIAQVFNEVVQKVSTTCMVWFNSHLHFRFLKIQPYYQILDLRSQADHKWIWKVLVAVDLVAVDVVRYFP